jgi:hypothetical protein
VALGSGPLSWGWPWALVLCLGGGPGLWPSLALPGHKGWVNKLNFLILFQTRITKMNTIEEIKRELAFQLFQADFEDPESFYQVEYYAGKFGQEYIDNEYPELYYTWKQLLEHIPREEAEKFVEEICTQIYNGQPNKYIK